MTDEPADAGLYCPQCGYDVRGLTSGRCPECGQLLDAADTVSRLPWSHRRRRGRLRAYLATAWIVIARPSKLYAEFARPTSLRDARRFANVTAALLCPVTLLAAGGLGYVLSEHVEAWYGGTSVVSSPVRRVVVFNGLVPLVCGWMATPLMAVLCVALTFQAVGVLAWLVHSPALPPPRRARAVALAHYQSATLVLLPAVAFLLTAAALVYTQGLSLPRELNVWLGTATGAGLLAGAVTLLVTAVRTAGFCRRAFFGGVGRAVLGPVLVGVGWLTLTVFWLAAVPWAFGAAWLLWRGLR